MIRLENGDTSALTTPLTTQTLDYIGSTNEADDSPDYNAAIVPNTVKFVTQGNDLTTAIAKLDYALDTLVPIGTIFAFYDYNATLTFDNTKWGYCNGQVLVFRGIGASTTPDLSGRYLVGFGTDGGADIGTVAWAVPAVGNASHQINLQHLHVNTLAAANLATGAMSGTAAGTCNVNAFVGNTGSGGAHTHSMGHAHGIPYSVYNLTTGGPNINIPGVTTGGSTSANTGPASPVDHVHNYGHSHGAAALSGGTCAIASKTITHSAASHTLTNVNAGSTTQSIQPSSIRVRYLIRYN